MLISPAPPLPQNSAAATQPQQVPNNVHQVAAQATAPISQQAIVPTEKTEKTAATRAKDRKDPKDPVDRRKDKKDHKEEEKGSSVNISV